MQQFYDSKRVFNIAGKSGAQIEYDPKKIRDVEFDLSITESTSTPAYRHLANDMLMQLYQSQAISVEQLLEHEISRLQMNCCKVSNHRRNSWSRAKCPTVFLLNCFNRSNKVQI